MALSARIRFGATRSSTVPRHDLGETVEVWCDFVDETGAAVDASGVAATVWYPGGAERDPSLTPVEETAGTWRVDVPALLYAGLWTVRFTSTEPSVASATASFSVSSAQPAETVYPSMDFPSLEAMLAAAYEAGSANRLRKRLDELVEDDPTGVADMAPSMNAALLACRIAGVGLDVPNGERRLNSHIEVAGTDDVYCYLSAEFVAYFNSSGRNGMVTLSSADWTATIAGTRQRHMRWEGGIFRRNGTLSGDGKTWTGNTGSIFSLWGDHVELTRIWCKGWSVGRAIQGGGFDWKVDRILCFNNDNYRSLPCPGTGGNGLCRFYSAGPMVGTRIVGICGDDALQVVAQAIDLYGQDLVDITYSDCWVTSIRARACVCALTIPNDDRFDPSDQFSQTLSIARVTFRSIRGAAKIPCAFYNTDSSGTLGTILFDDVRLSVITDLDGAAAPYAVEILGLAGTAGAGPIIFRDFELLNVLEGGIRCRGSAIGRVEFNGFKLPASANAASAYYMVHVQDAVSVLFSRGSIAGPAGGTKSLVLLGRNDENYAVDLARFEAVEFSGVPSAAYAIAGSVYGAVRLEVERCQVTPDTGVTDARAIDFPDNCARALVAANDFSACGSVPYVNIPTNTEFRENEIAAAATETNGIVYQQIAAADTIAWNGWSRLIRLTATGDVTINTITIPADYVRRDIPEILLTLSNNFTVTLGSSGNIVSGGTLTLNQTARVFLDFPTNKFRRLAA